MSGDHLFQHVIYDLTVLFLRTEQDGLCIFADFYRVPGRPVEQVTAIDHFLGAACESNSEFPLQQVAPVWTLAKVSFQPLEQGRDVRTGAERKVLAADPAVPGRIAEIRLLSGYRAWHIDSNRYVFLGYPHGVFLRFGADIDFPRSPRRYGCRICNSDAAGSERIPP